MILSDDSLPRSPPCCLRQKAPLEWWKQARAFPLSPACRDIRKVEWKFLRSYKRHIGLSKKCNFFLTLTSELRLSSTFLYLHFIVVTGLEAQMVLFPRQCLVGWLHSGYHWREEGFELAAHFKQSKRLPTLHLRELELLADAEDVVLEAVLFLQSGNGRFILRGDSPEGVTRFDIINDLGLGGGFFLDL